MQSGFFFNPLHKQEPGVLNENSYFPHAPQSGARKEKASLFSMSQASVFRANEMQRSQQSFVSGVSFPKQVSRPPCSPHWPALIWPLGSPGCRRCAHRLEKQGWDIKETRVLKRKTRMRCRGNVLLHTGCSYRGPFQVDHPVCLFQSPPTPYPHLLSSSSSFGLNATHLDAQG